MGKIEPILYYNQPTTPCLIIIIGTFIINITLHL